MNWLLEESIAAQLVSFLSARTWRVACAESCTGGMLSAAITSIPGSSAVFWGSFVTYSEEAKRSQLDVPAATLQSKGAVSAACARAMVEGALARSGADLAIAVTGYAGPGGGDESQPVGTVWIAAATKRNEAIIRCYHFEGDREGVRKASVGAAISLALECAGN